MATFSTEFLSASTDGQQIKVAATSSPGTLIHTADANAKDIVFLYACNTDTVSRDLTIEWGGTTSPDDTVIVTLAAKSGMRLVVPGLPLTNSKAVRAFGSAANVIVIGGSVSRVS
ncbi:hypothetical protein [Ferrovibrio sp.]|uniref:hypothetical protein n=1 Tax=Ferrovibrio sp. TaxID=1917215 RepID=UPI00311EE037